MEHCCTHMRVETQKVESAVKYIPKFREYGILILDGGTSLRLIEYCPWCGARLPASLRDAWFKELEKLGLTPADSLPSELQSDAWWRSTKDEYANEQEQE